MRSTQGSSRNQRVSQDDGRQTADDGRHVAGGWPLSVVYRQWSVVITCRCDLSLTNILAHDASLAVVPLRFPQTHAILENRK